MSPNGLRIKEVAEGNLEKSLISFYPLLYDGLCYFLYALSLPILCSLVCGFYPIAQILVSIIMNPIICPDTPIVQLDEWIRTLLLLYQVLLPSYYEPDWLAICLFRSES